MNVRIDKIEIISFGKLKNAVLETSGGINVLSAPNESGKSTLAAFIKFVFYGFSGTRSQSLAENERKLYSPWDGELSAGSLNITADGARYTVERRCLPSGKETFSVTERATGKAAFPGETPGEVFFGVSEEVFARTLFFRQLTQPQSKDDILADRLQNIAISADEQVNTSKAIAKLGDAKNELKNRIGNGLIPRLCKTRDELDRQLEDSMRQREQAHELLSRSEDRAKKIAAGEKKLEELNAERRNIEKFEALTKLRNISRLREEEKAAMSDYQLAGAGLKSRENVNSALRELSELNSEYVAEKTRLSAVAETLNAAEAEKRELESSMPISVADAKRAEKELSSKRKAVIAVAAAALALALAGLIVMFAVNKLTGTVMLGAAVAAAAVAGAMAALRAGVAKEFGFGSVKALKYELSSLPEKAAQLKSAEARVSSLRSGYESGFARCSQLKTELDGGISKYVDAGGEDYSGTLQSILELSTESGEKFAVWNIKKEELQKALENVDPEALAEEARGAVAPARERATVDTELKFYTQQCRQLSELQHRDELDIAALNSKSGDPALIVGKRDSLNSRIAELELQYKAYEAAIAAINESGDYMKSMVAPRISSRADEYFRLATGDKYGDFEVDTRLSMSYGSDFRRSCEYLSAGTRDSAYLSLRLALADMLFGGAAVPMILDDAFVRIDDERLKMISYALGEAAKKHQIFILTHGHREASALDSAGVTYNSVEIRQA